MRDDYILRQRRKIKKRLWELLSLRYLALLGVCLLSLMALFTFDLPPQMWPGAEITITDMEYRSKPFLFTEHGNPGYALTDQDGERYWIYEDEAQLQVGQTYSVRYVDRGYYRFFQSVTQEDAVLIDLQASVDQWYRDLPIWIAVLLVFLLTLIGTVRYSLRLLTDEIVQQHREKLRSYRDKKCLQKN